jgi:hypothetical protein
VEKMDDVRGELVVELVVVVVVELVVLVVVFVCVVVLWFEEEIELGYEEEGVMFVGVDGKGELVGIDGERGSCV